MKSYKIKNFDSTENLNFKLNFIINVNYVQIYLYLNQYYFNLQIFQRLPRSILKKLIYCFKKAFKYLI